MSKALIKSADLEYYSFDYLMSYNAQYNFCTGARGLGKSYGMKKFVIKDAIKSFKASKGKEIRQFIYLRRYKPELKAANTFFADIFHEFPDWDFKTEGEFALMSPASERWKEDDKKEKREWHVIGFFMALVTAQHRKSQSFPNVVTIIYDEFIIEKGHIVYLTNEAEVFNNFYMTIDRWKDKTRVFFLANALSIINPFFLEYDILPEDGEPEEMIVTHGGFIAAHFPDSAKFSQGTSKTRFGRFIKGTSFEQTAVGNKFTDNNRSMIGLKPATAMYQMTIETPKGVITTWVDWDQHVYYVQSKRPKKETIWVLDPARMTEKKLLTERSDKRLQRYRAAFSQGRVFFDNPRTRNAFIEIFRR